MPGPVTDNNERITSRPYDDFATFPPEEIQPITAPGGGPSGAVAEGRNPPLVLVAVGYAVCFATFAVQQPLFLAAGVVLIVAGAAWGKATRGRRGKGLGPSMIRRG